MKQEGQFIDLLSSYLQKDSDASVAKKGVRLLFILGIYNMCLRVRVLTLSICMCISLYYHTIARSYIPGLHIQYSSQNFFIEW